MFETLQGGVHNLPHLILKVFGVYIALTLASIVLAAPLIDYACNHSDVVSYGLLLFLASLVACACIVVLYSRLQDLKLSTRGFVVLSFAMALALFAGQLYLEKSAGFTTGWDVGVLTQVGDRAPEDVSSLARYFSVYPNQLFLFGLFHKLAALATLVGVSTYRFLVYCGCLCVTVSILLTTFVCKRLFGATQALLFQIIASLFLGLNGWVLVPYSDAYGMLFTCAVLWFYVVARRRSVRLFGVTTASLLGYMVKPTAVFLLFAIICLSWVPRIAHALCSSYKAMRQNSHGKKAARSARKTLTGVLTVTLPVLLGAVLAMGLGHFVKGNYFDIDPNASRGMTHFLAMGMNPDTKGVYSEADNQLSNSISNPDERKAAQLALWKKRLAELGPIGVAKLWFQKNLTNYASGTFAWKDEGSFIVEITGDSPAVQQWFGITSDNEGTSPATAYGWYCQILWFVVLLSCSTSALRRARSMRDAKQAENSTNQVCCVIALTLIFLSGFLLIFEARARYLFLFSPYYVLLAIDGLVGAGSMGEHLARRVYGLRSESYAKAE